MASSTVVASGQIDGAGPAEIVTPSGDDAPPRVRAFDGDGSPRPTDFDAFVFFQPGGARVAACDFDGDGPAEIVTAPGPNAFSANVESVSLDGVGSPTGSLTVSPYGDFLGGIFVACGDVDGDGIADLITGADAGGAPHVRVFKILLGADVPIVSLVDFFALPPALR